MLLKKISGLESGVNISTLPKATSPQRFHDNPRNFASVYRRQTNMLVLGQSRVINIQSFIQHSQQLFENIVIIFHC